MNEPELVEVEVHGTGRIVYRCAGCGEGVDPEDAQVVEGLAYHPEHTPLEDRHDGS